jgi:hypothetical protein
MSPTIRTLLTSFLIAAVAPVGLAALEQPAFANNGNGHGGGNGGGHGGGNGGGHGGDHGNSATHDKASGHAKTTTDADATSDTDTDEDSDTDGLAPNELGKLNGVLHASPNAIAHANANSPIGTAREFGEALGGFLGDQQTEEGTTEGTTTEGTTTEDTTEPVTIDQLGEMMANMTNKPVTAEQVEAVAGKLGIETAPDDEDATPDDPAATETSDEPSDTDEAPKLDEATAQAIADKANEIHGFTTDTSDEEVDGSEETATN